MLLVSSTLFLPFPADQGYGDTRSTLAHRTVIQTALSAMLNQSTLGRTFTLLYRPRADAQPFTKWKMEIGNALRPYCDPKLHGFCLKWRYADYGFLENLEAPCRRRSCAVAVARRRVPDWGFIGT